MNSRGESARETLRLTERDGQSEVTAKAVEVSCLGLHPIQVSIQQLQDFLLVVVPFGGNKRPDDQAASCRRSRRHPEQLRGRFNAVRQPTAGARITSRVLQVSRNRTGTPAVTTWATASAMAGMGSPTHPFAVAEGQEAARKLVFCGKPVGHLFVPIALFLKPSHECR